MSIYTALRVHAPKDEEPNGNHCLRSNIELGCMISALFLLILFTTDLWAGETLLYAIRYESPERTPDVFYTQILSVDPAAKETRTIFSDEKTPIRLMNRRGEPGYPGEVLVSANNRIFAHAVDRKLKPGRWYHHKPAALYEVSTDGSTGVRKILDVLGEHALSELFVSPRGDKIGYINEINFQTFFFIHDTETGDLLYKVDTRGLFLDCFASTIGWLSGGKRLFFTLHAVDMDMTSRETFKREGSYIINEDGTGLTKLPKSLSTFNRQKGFRKGSVVPECIGELDDGAFLFRDLQVREGTPRPGQSSFLYKANPGNSAKEMIPLKRSANLGRFKLSSTGRQIAYVESGSSEDAEYIWVKDLDTGEERRVLSFSKRPFKGFFLGLVGWMKAD